MPQVDLADAGPAIETAMVLLIDEGMRGLKMEAAIETGDKLAHTQRRDTGRLQASTQVSGRQLIKLDPQAGIHAAASRTELTQAAEATIAPDRPQDIAHVSEGAGLADAGEYGGHVERRFGLAQEAVDATNGNARVVVRAERRASRVLRGKI